MTDTLSPEQIAALFEAAKSGDIPEASGGQQRRGQRMRSVDFSRPTKFTADHQRRITRAMESFCVSAAARLTGELRQLIELETLTATQVTWINAQTLIPGNSLAATLVTEPLGTKLLMTVESSFALNAIECLLGGGTERAAKVRRFSEIDWTLCRRLLDSIALQLSIAFHDLGGINLRLEELEMELHDASSLASVSEPTLVLVLEARMGMHSAAITLLIPWLAIDPVSDLIAGRDPALAGHNLDSVMDEALSHAPVTLRAEVASIPLSISEILSLKPGDVVRLGASAADGVSLYAENTKIGRANAGANGAKRSIQIRDDI